MWELSAGTAQQFYHDMRGEGGSRVTSKLKQGAHIHQPTAITSRMRTAISRGQSAAIDSCFALNGAHQQGIAVSQWLGKTRVWKTLSCRGESFKSDFL